MEAIKSLFVTEAESVQVGCYEVTGIGNLQIINTGGSSSSEGGMGSGSDDDQSKGDLSKSGDKSGSSKVNEEETFDPIGKNIREKERENESGKE
jgi:hypothetical protein